MANELPAPFQGATHRNRGTGEPVKAVLWNKDGAHSKVVRYPIERRSFKGLLEVSAKEKYALNFGDYVLEDAVGRLWVVSAEQFAATYAGLEG